MTYVVESEPKRCRFRQRDKRDTLKWQRHRRRNMSIPEGVRGIDGGYIDQPAWKTRSAPNVEEWGDIDMWIDGMPIEYGDDDQWVDDAEYRELFEHECEELHDVDFGDAVHGWRDDENGGRYASDDIGDDWGYDYEPYYWEEDRRRTEADDAEGAWVLHRPNDVIYSSPQSITEDMEDAWREHERVQTQREIDAAMNAKWDIEGYKSGLAFEDMEDISDEDLALLFARLRGAWDRNSVFFGMHNPND